MLSGQKLADPALLGGATGAAIGQDNEAKSSAYPTKGGNGGLQASSMAAIRSRGGILIFLWLAGCAGPPAGPRMADVYRGLAPVPESKARVLFIRSDETTMTGLDLKVRFYVDGTRVVELPISACHYMDLKPGRYDVALDAWSLAGSHKLKVDFEAGSQRY